MGRPLRVEDTRTQRPTSTSGRPRLPPINRLQLTRDAFRAYETRDRDLIEGLLAPDFSFHAPPDPHLDRAGYFGRCWPNAEQIRSYDLVRLFEHEDEAFVTYECTRSDGSRFRNTEVMSFDGERIRRVEVYFGWNLV